MSKELWLTSNNNQERIQLPVNPPELSISNGSQNETFNVSKLGEVTIIQDPKAKTFSFECFFPAKSGPYLNIVATSLKEPSVYVSTIDTWKASGNPVRFIVTESDINFLCSIEDFSYSEKAGDVGTIYYTLSLKEYRIVTPRTLQEIDGKLVAQDKPKRPGVIL
jgi:hypothetical protein